MILFLKHISIEGPGTIADFFAKAGRDIRVIELQDGDRIPENLTDVEAVVILGGPMNVYEEEKYPFLREENEFIKKVMEKGVPLLGICLGSQLIAKACGAEIRKSPVKEVGWRTVEMTSAGREDELFAGLKGQVEIFQWHEDTFDIPSGGKHLITGQDCRNQAFKAGESTYGIQFHIEVTEDMIKSWVRKYFKVNEARHNAEGQKMLTDYAAKKARFNQQAETIYKNFLKIINSCKKEQTSTA